MKQKSFSLSVLVLSAGLLVPLVGCSQKPSDNLDAKMQSLVTGLVQGDTSVKNCALSVLKGDGSFSWSGAAGIAHDQVRMTKDTPVFIASITKLYTAVVIMRLSERGAISLDDPMSKYLPGEVIQGIHVYKGKDYSREVTIRQLLSHSSGIADYYSEKGKDGKSLFDMFVENPDRAWTVDETIERARKDLKPNFQPGMGTSYSDTNFQLLGKIIETVAGMPLQNAFQDFIFRPVGLTHTWLVSRQHASPANPADVFYRNVKITKIRSNGSYWADGGIVSTADEMIAFLKALNEGKIVGRETLESMHIWRKWHFPLEYGLGTMHFVLPRPMSLVTKMPPLWGHSGSTGSFLYYCPDLDLYMAGTIDQADAQTKPFFLMYKVVREIQRRAGNSAQENEP